MELSELIRNESFLDFLFACNRILHTLMYKTSYTSKVWLNLTNSSQGASECLFLSSSDLKSRLEAKLDLFKYIFSMQIF